MKCVNPLDVKTRKCAFCGGKVTQQANKTWKCERCGFWYDKLVNVDIVINREKQYE